MEESSSNLAAGEIRRHQTSPYWTKSDLDTWYRSLQQVSKYLIYTVVTVTAQGRIYEIQNGVAETLASYIDTIEFFKNNAKFHRKRSGRGPLVQPLKSAHVVGIWGENERYKNVSTWEKFLCTIQIVS